MWQRMFGTRRKTQQYITIVSGLPRSGTSMMMHMLEAGGMEVVVDNIRQPDADNPHGYYEFEPVKHIKKDAAFLGNARGKAIKMISALLYDLPPSQTYKIIFMKRHLTEVLASQNIMLHRHGTRTQEADDQKMAEAFEKHLAEVTSWLAQQKHMDVLYVDYTEVITHPAASAQAVQHFLGNSLDVQRMAAVVDQALYRNRAASRGEAWTP
jgi:hypothetical protein